MIQSEDSQIGAMAMALMKHGFPHVSILEGGYSSVLKYLRSCDGRGVSEAAMANSTLKSKKGDDTPLGMHVLVDVDHERINDLFQTKSTGVGTENANPLSRGAAVVDLLSNTYGMFRRR